VSELWSWIGQHELGVAEAAQLYNDVRVMASVVSSDWTAKQLNAYLRTTSLSFRLGAERSAALEAETPRVVARIGGRLRLNKLVVAVTARRAAVSSTRA